MKEVNPNLERKRMLLPKKIVYNREE